MRISDMKWVERIILSSGIGTKIQREAMVRRLKDACVRAETGFEKDSDRVQTHARRRVQ